MEQINRIGKGVKHDFAIFNALAFITAIIGIASAMYHVCPNQTTSRIDMYFIEILLGYYSLKLYQSRVPDIRAVYYAPAIIVCVLSAVERVLGGSQLSWNLLAGFHLSFTLWVSIQLFFLGKCAMNPWTMYKEWSSVSNKIKEAKGKPEFKFQAGFFGVGILATSIIAGSAIGGYWTEQTMYNVVALSTDIVIYIMYYVVTKCVLRKEKLRTHVVVIIAASFFTWAVSFIFFFFYKNINTSVSPAESRCLNRACLGGFIDGHDLWHCLSATAIFLTNVMILLMDDDLLDMKTEDTYF
ncbi:SID1 transmembrane family member 1-like [Bolinopsis microptera]|uniref:SID1 transmembrane family member 1-like n=1 Tax=Bolinopsis microptera TaxID=2820187 RepID=UPI00307AA300